MPSRIPSCVAGTLMALGCDGPQSTLVPAGRAAEVIANLFWLMTIVAVLIWLAVLGLAAWATYAKPPPHGGRRVRALVIGGGVVLPTILLTALLIHGLTMLPDLLEPAPEGSLEIEVVGEQWWWRVRYLRHGESPVELANEIRLPLGRPVGFWLESPDVIHSFWIPALGGKTDMIPGRRTRLTLQATRSGEFRGVCAEYCGASHALMSFPVVVQEPQEFERWLADQAEPARRVSDNLAIEGSNVFLGSGCGACHTVRGTSASGVLGPDLTHVGSRLSLGAGVLGNDAAGFRRWLAQTESIKPGVHMPEFGMLPPGQLVALSAFLEALQ